MDFGFTEEEQRLRKEVHDFYVNELPADYSKDAPVLGEKREAWAMEFQRKLAQRGYLTVGWPKEYGGLGLGAIAQGVVNEEHGRWDVFLPGGAGFDLAGPATLLFGTEEQKKEFLPALARGDTVWFQCFTEPDAGTDEANIQDRAVKDGDDFIVNGQKSFITGSYKPDYLYTELRTEDTMPKHRGLSLFLIPADLPGITYRPMLMMGNFCVNDVFFDNVRVPEKYLLGKLNQGFYHAMATLEFERAGTQYPAHAKALLMEFVQFCKEEKRDGKPIIDDPQVRDTLAQMAVELEVLRLAAWRTTWRIGAREKLGPLDYDLTGYFYKTFIGRHAKRIMDILGQYGQLKRGSKWAKLRGAIEQKWQYTRSLHRGGTIEALKIVLAGRGLGLPRIPAKLNPVIGQALQEK